MARQGVLGHSQLHVAQLAIFAIHRPARDSHLLAVPFIYSSALILMGLRDYPPPLPSGGTRSELGIENLLRMDLRAA